MAKDPAFLFYSSDFLSGTLLFTSKQKGQYITILCAMHQSGRLTVEEMNNVLREKVDPGVLKKFKMDDSERFYNERLEQETLKRKKFAESRRNSLSVTNGDMVHIYLLYDPTKNTYKIGSSKYPGLRLAEAQKKDPRIELFWKTESLVERIKEKELQVHFKAKKVVHDWFNLSHHDITHIKNLFRTDIENDNRTDSRTENENTITSLELDCISKTGWTYKPGIESMNLELPDLKQGVVIELFLLTKNQKIVKEQVLTLWRIFKGQHFTGEKFYSNANEAYSHFINWSKTQNIESTKPQFQTAIPAGPTLQRL